MYISLVDYDNQIAVEHGIKFMETSAKNNINIDRAFHELAEAILNKTSRDNSSSALGPGVSYQGELPLILSRGPRITSHFPVTLCINTFVVAGPAEPGAAGSSQPQHQQ